MVHLLKNIILINGCAALVVLCLSQYIPFFQTTEIVDFLFFVVIVIWILAKLMWEGGVHGKTALVDDPISDKVFKMIKQHDYKQEQQTHYRQNYQTGLVFFIAGVPAFISCLVIQFL
ncbi:hypothetical protein [Vibrio sp. 10N.261.51.F12]|uniref:hypothetical protein n=1 Tax=Vibrio sp. 10N.261.51.F12 TaxID=3229679 RepID=UPI0035523CFF